jgi:hypothetical protein
MIVVNLNALIMTIVSRNILLLFLELAVLLNFVCFEFVGFKYIFQDDCLVILLTRAKQFLTHLCSGFLQTKLLTIKVSFLVSISRINASCEMRYLWTLLFSFFAAHIVRWKNDLQHSLSHLSQILLQPLRPLLASRAHVDL